MDDLYILAQRVAEGAGRVLLAGADRTVNCLGAHDVKIQADVDCEQIIRDGLAPSALPVIGEELGGDSTLPEQDDVLYWVVDPLDGTYNYLRNQPATCVSIALMRGSVPLCGVVHDFCGHRVYAGAEGHGVSINGIKAHPVWAKNLAEACLMTGFPAGMDKSPDALCRFMEDVLRFKKIRMIGSAALAVAYVGVGLADVYQEAGTNLWDVAAGLAILRAAGGFYKLEPSGKRPLNYNLRAVGRREWLA
jgi:myo-inositol-1(or 4)-monophosphatase